MRYRRQAIAAASTQAFVGCGHGRNAFGVGTATFGRGMDRLATHDYNMRKTCTSRSTRTAVRRSKASARDKAFAAMDAESGEHVFAAGGAEGIAELLAGENAGEGGVFYNRVGALNRDLSILMANVLAEERLQERRADGRRKKRRRQGASSSPSPIPSTTLSIAAKRGSGRGARVRLKEVWGRLGVGRRWVRTGRHAGSDDATVLSDGNRSEEQPKTWEDDGDGLVVLDAFAASGVRALRYLTEVPNVQRVVANDYDTAAIKMIRKAAELCGAGRRLEVQHSDALDTLYAARAGGLGTFDIIDIDPFGCAAGFLDAGVQAVRDGGLLCVTSTDMPALSGAQPEVALARYGSVPTRSGYHHEMSLRILLHAISAAAGRHRRSIKPVLSVAIDHYVRVFVCVSRSPKAALAAARESASYVLQSETCPSFFLLPVLPPKKQPPQGVARSDAPRVASPPNLDQEVSEGASSTTNPGAVTTQFPLCMGGVCPETGGALKIGGPIWSGPLHDADWVSRAMEIAFASKGSPGGDAGDVSRELHEADLLAPRPRLAAGIRVESLLKAVAGELPDVALFYNLRDMFATLGFRMQPRREQVMRALEAAGYRVSGMHREPLAVKTDAPDAAVWDVLRCWARDNPQPPPVRAAGSAILSRGAQLIAKADFDAVQSGPGGEAEGVATRAGNGFLHTHNPEEGWGPLARPSGVTTRVRSDDKGAEIPVLQPE